MTEGQHDARVQVLTAEVRALMVGSRQVTMSVYNQLDVVECSEIEAFGRVRTKEPRKGWVYVVGRHKKSGALVRASAQVWELVREPSAEEAAAAKSGARSWEWSEMTVAELWAGARDETAAPHLRAGCAYEIARRDAERERQPPEGSRWEELPLIVLAGLR